MNLTAMQSISIFFFCSAEVLTHDWVRYVTRALKIIKRPPSRRPFYCEHLNLLPIVV